MTRKSYAPFEALGTRFRNRFRTDAFFVARLQMAGLYFLVATAIFVIFGWIWGYVVRLGFYQIARTENGPAVDHAIMLLENQLLFERFVMLSCFAVAAYFLSDFALRSVKKSAELHRKFAAIVSHELRTPLAIMKNASEVALRNVDALDKDKAVRILRSNLEETNRLTETVQFLLTFSVLKNADRIVEERAVSLVDMAENLAASLEKEASDQGVRIAITREGACVVQGNATALEGVFMNLVRNAIRHAPRGSFVTIALSEDKGSVRLSVSDTGHGIAKKDLPYIFEPFYRGDQEGVSSGKQGGVGLGLSIVKEVVELHRASLSVSTVYGKGTTFTVVFPRASYPHHAH